MTQITQEETRWAMICHLAGLVWIPLYWLEFPLPLVNIVVPGVVWLVKREESEYVDLQGREALNFQIALVGYSIILFMLGVMGFFIYLAVFGADLDSSVGAIALVMKGISWAARAVAMIATLWSLAVVPNAAIRAKKGQIYFYPLTMRVFTAKRDD
ncbi:hypothetical protein PCC7418_1734 [Halothece sp. PCC 7418]|uniref:DUF4870 domain-containing protein n=1 Tax=Halothece sp. (strain PCC 7418) TaxID=65093 RepID=UPI0002A08259|nr:DUF4870 domain-containing protein [Halothece sp. PCC 7418]AFZ43903.1 hypothetical protein PCC7418_1734 [Halothece sp. PCC 7418]